MDQNFIRGLNLEQYKTVVEKKQETTVTRYGIVESVNIIDGFALVAVPGGDPDLNYVEVRLINTKEGSEGVLGDEVKKVASHFVRYRARMPEPVDPGMHVQITFISGRIEPIITGIIPVFKDKTAPQNNYIAVDKDGNGFRFLEGGSDTYWTKQNGPRGFRFAPYSQNTLGSRVLVSNNLKVKSLLRAKTPNAKTIKNATEESTPSGVVPWVDESGQGHIGLFGDIVHNLGKEINQYALGSNEPVNSFLKDPLNDLANALGVEIENPLPDFIYPESKKFRLAPLISDLAIKERNEWLMFNSGFVSLIEPLDSFYNKTNTNNASFATYVRTSGGINFKYLIASALTAGILNQGETVTNIPGPYFQSINIVSSLNNFNYETSDNQQTLTQLNGYGYAWINLITALRLSLLSVPAGIRVKNLLINYPLLLYKLKDSNNKALSDNLFTLSINNLFGFPTTPNSTSSLLEKRANFQTLELLDPAFVLSPESKKQYTYGDLVHANLQEITNNSSGWIKNSNIFVPNLGAFKSNLGTKFQDRVYFVDPDIGTNAPTLLGLSSIISGLYAAQVRTVVQEVLYIAQEYITEVENLTGRSVSPLKPSPISGVKVTDNLGNSQTGTNQMWTSSFIVYLMLRLFNGSIGKEAASYFMNTYAGKSEAINKEQFVFLLQSYNSSITDLLAKTWWESTIERYKFVANTLSRVQAYWRV